MRVLPGVQVVQPATWEYQEEHEQRVRLRSEDRIEFKERVNADDGRDERGRGGRVEHCGLCHLGRGGLASGHARACSGRPCLRPESEVETL